MVVVVVVVGRMDASCMTSDRVLPLAKKSFFRTHAHARTHHAHPGTAQMPPHSQRSAAATGGTRRAHHQRTTARAGRTRAAWRALEARRAAR